MNHAKAEALTRHGTKFVSASAKGASPIGLRIGYCTASTGRIVGSMPR